MGPVILQRSSALYALEIGQEYEVQVRCKPQSEGNFSTFSDSLCFSLSPQRRPLSVLPGFISLASTVLPPLAVFLSLFVLYVLCSGTRIKHVLLPPIPVPKITGINMELLWGGQPSDLGITYNSIKCSPEMSEENWEEFPETDFQDDTTSHMLESGKGPQAGNCADGSDSGCESMDSSDIDYSRDSLPVSYNSLETISSEMAPSPGLDEDGNIRSFAKPQRDPLKLLAAFCTFAEGQEDDRMPQYRKAQVGQVLFKYNDSGGFYSHVKPLASESGVIAQADGGIVPPTATTVNQGHWQMLSKHLRGTAPESASSPEHTDANYYVIL
ncbi:GHR protein, partial [Amia calva]|nr:GHR protein [Amia calva]